MDEQDLERLLRDGLEERASDADVTAPVAARARDVVARRRRRRWSVAAAAAAVVVIAGATAVVANDRDEPSRQADTPPSDRHAGLPAQWRTEYWHDVAVDVPASWGYGGAPDESGVACYPEAMVGPDGGHVDGGNGLGYVGRPIAATDSCALVPKAWEPRAPYVWLGAAVEPGTYDYDNGYVQETVEVDGTTVTVGTDDTALRQRILDTVQGGEMCLSELGRRGSIEHDAAPAGAEPASLRVCAYQAGEDQATETLAYAADLGRSALDRYQAALADAAPGWIDGCPTADYVSSGSVVLEVVDRHGAVIRQDVVTTQCSLAVLEGADDLSLASGTSFKLSPDLVAPWAVGGVPATVQGAATTSDQKWLDDYFIGPLG